MDISALYDLSYGVYLVTAMDGDRPTGCIANSIMQITSDPVTIALSMNHDNYTHGCISKTGRFAVSILPQDAAPALIGRFGFRCGRDFDKFEGIRFRMANGTPLPEAGMCGHLVCEVTDRMETPTHTVFLAKVTDAERAPGKTPMTYAYYHSVIKGKSPKNAPTYQAPEKKEPAARTVWKCRLCGYVYDGTVPFEELPEDYRCPICGAPKSSFEKVTV
jgi:flavin reductase (DIM6/NTAB) family NADH-FMN oxidoreductase RutF/rubredoxin